MRSHNSISRASEHGVAITLDLTREEAAALTALASAKGVKIENVLYDLVVALNAPKAGA